VADTPTRPRCVFDCVVLLQAAVSRRGPAFALLTQVEVGRLELLISDSAIAELREVLVRPAVQRKFPVLTADVVEAFVGKLMAIATLIQPVPAVFRLPRDADDELYINLALAGNAHYLITRDRDLLDLAAQATREAQYLRRLRPELRILDPVALLRELSAESL
jgi:putative PIN family toxin of toxin-antitoxin system